jgi:hypothetical protein
MTFQNALCKHVSWNIENSNQLPQQLKHTRAKLYIYVILEYRVPWHDLMYSLFNGMYLFLTKLNFRCAFMFSNPFLRDRLFCFVPKGTLSVFRKEWLEIYKYPLPDGGLLRDFNQVVYCRGINNLVSVEIPKIGT